MLAISDRVRSESQFWDDVAARHENESDWEPVHDVLLTGLGPVEGTLVLDCGCGEGGLSRAAARRGAFVVGFDVSFGSVTSAATDGKGERQLQAAFEHLPFADGAFAAVTGKFVLHHVDLAQAAPELARVMAPGARGSFMETWQQNILFRLARHLRGHAGVAKWGTDDERPLVPADLEPLRNAGLDVSYEYPGFVFLQMLDVSVLRRRWGWATRALRRADAALAKLRWIRPYGYYMIIRVTRPPSATRRA